MNKELEEYPFSIKLVKDIHPNNRYYRTNYCLGLCGQNEHKYDRLSVPIDRFINISTFVFNLVLSIDLSCMTITKQLLVAIIQNCPKLECLIINKTVFENQKTWDYFCTQLISKLKPRSHLAIDNQIFIKQNGGKRRLNDFQLLFKYWKIPEAMRVYFDERKSDDWVFADSFEFVGQLDFFHLVHSSEEDCCVVPCSCKEQSEEESSFIPMSNTNTIIKYVKQNSPNLKYLRFHTDMCAFQVRDALQIVSQFKEQNAVHLDFNNSLFDYFYGDDLTLIFDSFSNSSPKLKGLGVGRGLSHICQSKLDTNLTTLRLTDRHLNSYQELHKRYERLETLALFDCQVHFDEFHLLIRGFKHLKKLIIGCNDFDVEKFGNVVNNNCIKLIPVRRKENKFILRDIEKKRRLKLKICPYYFQFNYQGGCIVN